MKPLNNDLSIRERRALVEDTLEHLASIRHDPPATVTLRFCSTCGADSRSSRFWLHYENPRNAEACPGSLRILTYELRSSDRATDQEAAG